MIEQHQAPGILSRGRPSQSPKSRQEFKELLRGRTYDSVQFKGHIRDLITWPGEYLIKTNKVPQFFHVIKQELKEQKRLKYHVSGRNAASARVKRLLKKICDKHGVTIEEFMSSGRANRLILPRREFCVAMKDAWSYSRIGRFMGRDHSTVLYHVRKAEQNGQSITL